MLLSLLAVVVEIHLGGMGWGWFGKRSVKGCGRGWVVEGRVVGVFVCVCMFCLSVYIIMVFIDQTYLSLRV